MLDEIITRESCIGEYINFIEMGSIESLGKCSKMITKLGERLETGRTVTTREQPAILLRKEKNMRLYNRTYNPEWVRELIEQARNIGIEERVNISTLGRRPEMIERERTESEIKKMRFIEEYINKLNRVFDFSVRENLANVISIVIYSIYKDGEYGYRHLYFYMMSGIVSLMNIEKYLSTWIYRIYMDISVFEAIIKLYRENNPLFNIYYNILKYFFKSENCELYIKFSREYINHYNNPSKMAETRTERFEGMYMEDVNISISREADGIVSMSDCYNLKLLDTGLGNRKILYSIINLRSYIINNNREDYVVIDNRENIRKGFSNNWGVFMGKLMNYIDINTEESIIEQLSRINVEEFNCEVPYEDESKLEEIGIDGRIFNDNDYRIRENKLKILKAIKMVNNIDNGSKITNNFLLLSQMAGLIGVVLKVRRDYFNRCVKKTEIIYNLLKLGSLIDLEKYNSFSKISIGFDEMLIIILFSDLVSLRLIPSTNDGRIIEGESEYSRIDHINLLHKFILFENSPINTDDVSLIFDYESIINQNIRIINNQGNDMMQNNIKYERFFNTDLKMILYYANSPLYKYIPKMDYIKDNEFKISDSRIIEEYIREITIYNREREKMRDVSMFENTYNNLNILVPIEEIRIKGDNNIMNIIADYEQYTDEYLEHHFINDELVCKENYNMSRNMKIKIDNMLRNILCRIITKRISERLINKLEGKLETFYSKNIIMLLKNLNYESMNEPGNYISSYIKKMLRNPNQIPLKYIGNILLLHTENIMINFPVENETEYIYNKIGKIADKFNLPLLLQILIPPKNQNDMYYKKYLKYKMKYMKLEKEYKEKKINRNK